MFKSAASAVGLRDRSAKGGIRTLTVQVLDLLPLPLGYLGVVPPVGFEPTLHGV